MKVLRSILLALGLLAALAGCASLGRPFSPGFRPVREGGGLPLPPVQLRGLGGFLHGERRELPIVSLSNGGYFPYIASPGRISFWAKTEAESFVIIDVEPGLEYYLKGTVGMGVLVGRPKLEQVPAAWAGWKSWTAS